jgi:hypothetical protein
VFSLRRIMRQRPPGYVYSPPTIANIGIPTIINNPNTYGVADSDGFGISVACSNTHTTIGAFKEDIEGVGNAGKVYIYLNSTGELLHVLENPNYSSVYATGDSFGNMVACSETYSVVGVPYEDDVSGRSSGVAYVYDTASGSLLHTWVDPNPYGTPAGDRFGFAISCSDSYAVVGAPYEDNALYNSVGAAYIYDIVTGSLLYTLDNPNVGIDSVNYDYFGWSVGCSETYSIVGADSVSSTIGAGNNSGCAYIYLNATGALLHTLVNPNADSVPDWDNFGTSVACSELYSVVGVPYETGGDGAFNSVGRVYVFQNSTGNLIHTLEHPDVPESYLYFGWSVSCTDKLVIVGTDDGRGVPEAAKFYIYDIVTGALLVARSEAGDQEWEAIAQIVSISDTHCVVSHEGAPNGGSARLYSLL